MNATLSIISGYLTIAILTGAVYSWVVAALRLQRREPILDYAARRPVPWGFVDFVFVVIVFVVVATIARSVTLLLHLETATKDNDSVVPNLTALLTFSLVSLASCGLSLWVISLRTGADGHNFGWRPRQISVDLGIGVWAFVFLIVPVFAIQYVLLKFFEPAHPIIDLLRQDSSRKFFLATGFMAVVAAPIVEEILFRVLLQGWLENLAMVSRSVSIGKSTAYHIFMGRRPTFGEVAEHSWPDAWGAAKGSDADASPPQLDTEYQYSNPPPTNSPTSSPPQPVDGLEMQPSLWPIVISSAAFAAVHFGHGTDPIPLFVLACGLGWLYQRTHRVIPCIVVHMLLNGISLLQLAVYLSTPAA